MNKKLKTALFIVSLIGLGFCLGYLKGMHDGTHIRDLTNSFGYASYIGLHREASSQQYKDANYTDAHSALTEYIEVLKQGLLNVCNDSFLTEESIYYDLGLTYARLALLEEKQGNDKAMNEYFEMSLEAYKAKGYEDFSIEKIREYVNFIDEVEPGLKREFYLQPLTDH
jgi:hypothetical protein